MARIPLTKLLNVAIVAGPAIWKIVSRYGPVLIDLRNKNPQAFDKVAGSVKGLAGSMRPGSGNLASQAEVVRKQINYLVASADDDAELARVSGWRRRLEKIEAAVPLLDAMSTKVRKAQTKTLRTQLDTLAAEVLDAFIGEQAEDSGIVTQPTHRQGVHGRLGRTGGTGPGTGSSATREPGGADSGADGAERSAGPE
ncbi:MAG: hypothetical protein ACTHXO_06580 [Actinomycetaceae bacterium]